MIKQPIKYKLPMSHVRLRAAVYVERNSRVLLVHDPYYRGGCWILPGGGVEFSETVIDGAVREVLEETGVTVKIRSVWRFREIWEPESQVEENPVMIRKSMEFIFLGDYVSGTIDITGCLHEKNGGKQIVKECRWFLLSEIGSTINGIPVYPEELFHSSCPRPIKGVSLDSIMLPLLNLGGKT